MLWLGAELEGKERAIASPDMQTGVQRKRKCLGLVAPFILPEYLASWRLQPFLSGPYTESVGRLLQYWLQVLTGKLVPVVVGASLMSTRDFL